MIITNSGQITLHFNANEFRCQCCNKIKIDTMLIDILERLFTATNAKYIIITSGYRCDSYDKKIGGFVGNHSKGIACDFKVMLKSSNWLESKYICCKLQDIFNQLNIKTYGIAKINDSAVHLDIRTNGTYKGDETKSNNTVTNDFHKYFGV